MSVAERVRKQFKRLPEGGVIASRALHHLSADSQQVDKAASRLYQTEGLQKLRNGLYYRPYCSQYFGPLPPKERDIIQSVKKQYKARIIPTGPLAAYDLGLTNELPEKIIYDTDKRIAPVNAGNGTIYFRQVDGKKVSSTKERLFALLKALEFLFKDCSKLKALQHKRVVRILSDYSSDEINKVLLRWPRWFREEVQIFLIPAKVPYITGLSALNIPYEGKYADWHQMGLLNSKKFQIAGKNYDGAPNLAGDELFDCNAFLNKYDIDLDVSLCAKPLRAIKDILYSSIIKKQTYPSFFMLDQYVLDISEQDLIELIDELKRFGNSSQQQLLIKWACDNDLH